jgi:nucleoside-diphosphate-sugar epimerase
MPHFGYNKSRFGYVRCSVPAQLCTIKSVNQKIQRMRVFVTGATGFIGSAIVQELIGAGHQVLGLARSDAAAASLLAAGAKAHRGDLDDPGSLRIGAAASDAVIHTGFIHDFSRFKAVCETDRSAIAALGSALAGSDRPLIVTSGIGLLAPGKLATEEDMPASTTNPRVASEEAADALAAGGVRVSVVRLPPSVHGIGDHGFVPMLIGIAREKGLSVYSGEGLNRWPAVHRLDAARLYRLVLDKAPAAGTRFHGVAEEGVAFRDIAEVIGKHLGIPVASKTPEEAAAHFAWFAHFAALDIPALAKQTREHLGWHPVQPGLIADIDQAAYFPA